MSPRRTQALHDRRDFHHLTPIVVVLLERTYFGSKGPLVSKTTGTLDERPPDHLRTAEPGGFEPSERPQRIVVEPNRDRPRHRGFSDSITKCDTPPAPHGGPTFSTGWNV